jgi:hypothetical protein
MEITSLDVVRGLYWALTVGGLVLIVLAMRRVYRRWLAQEEAKQAQRIRSLRAAMQLVDALDQQCGRPPRAPGFNATRVS